VLKELLTAPGCQLIRVDTVHLYPGPESGFDHNICTAGANVAVLRWPGKSNSFCTILKSKASALAILVFDDYVNDVLPDSFTTPCRVATDAFLAMTEGRDELIFKGRQPAI
jgi:hypothetical protein